MSIRLESPYSNCTTNWLRGNLHAHSTRSDGKAEPQAVIRRYAEMGYDFLALSDHDVLSDYSGLDDCGMVLLPANEVSGGAPHVLDMGARTLITGSRNHQQLLDDINSRSGFPILCHPNWEADFNHYPFELLASLKGYIGIEIYNGLVQDQAGFHLATDKWDRLLSIGRMVWGYANDDAHRIEHLGRGWNMVAAAERSPQAILEALRAGNFYASSGVQIERIECDGPNLTIVAPNADRIAVYGRLGQRLYWCDDSRMTFDVSEVAGPYVRVECFGRAGSQAWTQPFVIRGGQYDQLQQRLAELGSLKKSTLNALRTDRAPQLTGTLSDPLWQQAQVFDRFINLSDGGSAAVKTQVRVIVAEGALFIGVRCEEPELEKLKIGPGISGIWNTDSVEVFVDPQGKGINCYHIAVNAGGETVAASRGPGQWDNPPIVSKVGRYEEGGERGWCAELRVELDQLEPMPAPGTRWGFHVARNRFPQRGLYVWSWVGNSNHNRDQYGSLVL